jgi:hypothetical protein
MNAVLKPAAPVQTPGWVVLVIDDLKLALPQRDVRTIDVVSALEVATDGDAVAAWLVHNDARWPAYDVDEQLSPRSTTPTRRRFCVFLHDGDALAGILCDAVSLLVADADLVMASIPAALIEPHSPVRWAGLADGQMLAATRGDLLLAYLTSLEIGHDE